MTAIPLSIQLNTYDFNTNLHFVYTSCTMSTFNLQVDESAKLCAPSLAHINETECTDILEFQGSYEINPIGLFSFVTVFKQAELAQLHIFVSATGDML